MMMNGYQTTRMTTLLLVVCVVLAVAVTAAVDIAPPKATCTAGFATCPQSPSQCYNATAGEQCCGSAMCKKEGMDRICEAGETCCYNSFNTCDVGVASQTCCKKGSRCCRGTRSTVCAEPGEQCCGNDGQFPTPGTCPKNTKCCSSNVGSSCCTSSQYCCPGFLGQWAVCCEHGQDCDGYHGCLAPQCRYYANKTILAPTFKEAIVNASGQCCQLCSSSSECSAAVLTRIERLPTQETWFLSELSKRATGSERRGFINSFGPPVQYRCELKNNAIELAVSLGSMALFVKPPHGLTKGSV